MWKLYDALLASLPEAGTVESVLPSPFWTLAGLENGALGAAMTTEGATRPARLPGGLAGLPVREAAAAVKGWNLPEASAAMAVINACCNTPARLAALGCAEPYERYCTRDLDLTGKTVGLVGHLTIPPEILRGARRVHILERDPQPGDYPDTACEYLLPECDVALITGSALINKTLPRLLELCKNAYTILTGPTVPLCPALLELGVDRLAGLVITDPEGLRAHAASGRPGSPYRYGEAFLLTGGRG